MNEGRRELAAAGSSEPRRARSPPRARLPPLTGALDSSDDSARYGSREYRSQQAKRRRRAKQAAERSRSGPADSAANTTNRSQGGLDDSAAGDTSYRREVSADTSYHREVSGDTSYHREVSGDTSYRREVSGDTSYRPGDTSYRREVSGDSYRHELSGDSSYRREAALELASEPAEPSIADELSRLGEEVRSGSEAGGDCPPSLAPEPVPHPPVTKLFVEKGNRFQATKRQAAARAAGAAYSKKSQACAVDLALQTQRVFAPLGRFCFGLFAGLAVGHFMFVLALTRDSALTLDFVVHYSELALPFRAVFFTLSVICCVAALDRYDVGRASAAQLRSALTLQDGGVTVPMYLAALALSACLAPTDDRFHLYRRNQTLTGLWESRAAIQDDCRYMVVLCGVRAGVVLLAWLVVAANPALDRVLEYLRRLPTGARGAEHREPAVATIT